MLTKGGCQTKMIPFDRSSGICYKPGTPCKISPGVLLWRCREKIRGPGGPVLEKGRTGRRAVMTGGGGRRGRKTRRRRQKDGRKKGGTVARLGILSGTILLQKTSFFGGLKKTNVATDFGEVSFFSLPAPPSYPGTERTRNTTSCPTGSTTRPISSPFGSRASGRSSPSTPRDR